MKKRDYEGNISCIKSRNGCSKGFILNKDLGGCLSYASATLKNNLKNAVKYVPRET